MLAAYGDRGPDVRPVFREGASNEALAGLERRIGVPLPEALAALLRESNGVDEETCVGGEWVTTGRPVWSVEEIAAFRASSATDDPSRVPHGTHAVIAFAHAGVDGIVFAFLVDAEGGDDGVVHGYFPIDGEWRPVSSTLERHVEGWVV